MTVSFAITHQISHSKGWGRYSAKTAAGHMIQSATGNEWVSAPHTGDVAEGDQIIVTLQTQTVSGRGKKTTETTEHRLVATPDQTAVIGFWSGLEITVTGARVAE